MTNTPIEELEKEYDEDTLFVNYTDKARLVRSARRYVQTMPDSDVRVLLHKLANIVEYIL